MPSTIPRKKISVNLRPPVEEMLDALSSETGLKQTEIIQDAVKLLKFIKDEANEGRQLFTVDAEGNNAKQLVVL